MKKISERLRRFNTRDPLGDRDMADLLAEWEEDREHWEPGELNNLHREPQ